MTQFTSDYQCPHCYETDAVVEIWTNTLKCCCCGCIWKQWGDDLVAIIELAPDSSRSPLQSDPDS